MNTFDPAFGVLSHEQMAERIKILEGALLTYQRSERRQFAAMAMQGLCSNQSLDPTIEETAKAAIAQADALIAALNEHEVGK